MFCWTELGAKQVGIIQSLILTCRLHGVDAYTYQVDVLQRVSIHPAKDAIDLTPRAWKTKRDLDFRAAMSRDLNQGRPAREAPAEDYAFLP